jgi:hypothetical protein
MMKHIIDRLHLQMLYAGSRFHASAFNAAVTFWGAPAEATGAVDIT